MQVLCGTISVESLSLSPTVQLCLELGNDFEHGIVEYSQSIDEQEQSGAGGSAKDNVEILERGYPEGTMANITCNEGYRTNDSSITCRNGNWSGGVPKCTSESHSL